MPLNISNLSSALNNKINPPLPTPTNQTSTPQTSGISSPQYSSYGTLSGNTALSSGTPQTNQSYGASQIAQMTPSTPVKSVSLTHPNGMNQTTTYHAPENTYQPLFDYQKSVGGGTSMADLQKLASQYGISNYTGTDQQNTQLAGLLKSPQQPTQNVQGSSPTSSGYTNPDGTPVSNASPSQGFPNPQTGMNGQPPAPTYNANSGLFGQLVTGLANTPQNTQAVQDANALIANLKNNFQQQNNQILTNSGNLTQAGGRQGLLQNQYNTALSAAQTQLQNALTSQQQQQDALYKAAGLVAPTLAGYNQQSFNPITGQFSGGGSLQDAVNNIVQKIQSGQMTYDQATQALSGYGQGGINALQQALPQGFNIAQSASLAGQQGTIQPAYQYAKSALTNLQNAVSNLSSSQNTNIPIINQITQGVSTTFGVGSQAVQAYKGAIAEARSAIQKVLASVSGGTPTDYVGQSNALLPDNATPNQIQAAIQTLDTLGQAKVNIYGNPGQAGTQSSTATMGNVQFYQKPDGTWGYK